jgi:atlastin
MSGISKLKERPIQIVEERNNNYSKNKEYVLNEKALSYILMRKCDNESILNLPVMLVSIAGDYRKGKIKFNKNLQHKLMTVFGSIFRNELGKSFFLNFLIRYLKNPDDFESWINDPNSKLDGFISRFGQSLETVGIWMWSEPFVLTDAKGNKVVILLMDTQGTFDRKHSKKDNLTILSLSFMTSSLQSKNEFIIKKSLIISF